MANALRIVLLHSRLRFGACGVLLGALLTSSVQAAEPVAGDAAVEVDGAPPQKPEEDILIKDPKEAEARALFLSGLAQVRAGELEDGCFLLAQSLELVPRVTTRFNLADCLEKQGKQATALRHFLEVATAMKASGDSAREEAAEARAAALKGQVCRLRVQVEQPVKALLVRRDGEVLKESSWSRGTPVDRGTYSLAASAPGKLPWSVEVEVPVCPSIVSVKIPALTNALPAPAADASKKQREARSLQAGPDRSPNPRPPTSAVLPKDRGTGNEAEGSTPILAYGIVGYGVLSSTVGIVFLANYKSKNDQARAICPMSGNCSVPEIERHLSLVDDAKSARTKGIIGVSLGASALAVGGALLLSDFYSSKYRRTATWMAAPLLGSNGLPVTGAMLEGNF